MERLKNKKTLETYQAELSERVSNIMNESETVDNNWKNTQNVIKKTAEKVIGYQKGTKGKDWFDEECRMTVEGRNELRMQWIQRPTRGSKLEHKRARREAKRTK